MKKQLKILLKIAMEKLKGRKMVIKLLSMRIDINLRLKYTRNKTH